MEDEQVSLDKAPQRQSQGRRTASVAGAAAVGIGIAVWQPWVDRGPFTVYQVAVHDGEYTKPESRPGTWVRTSASEEERVILDEEGRASPPPGIRAKVRSWARSSASSPTPACSWHGSMECREAGART